MVAFQPERRSGKDRRLGRDRRKSINPRFRRVPEGRSGLGRKNGARAWRIIDLRSGDDRRSGQDRRSGGDWNKYVS